MTHVQYLHGDAGYRESGDSTILVIFVVVVTVKILYN